MEVSEPKWVNSIYIQYGIRLVYLNHLNPEASKC